MIIDQLVMTVMNITRMMDLIAGMKIFVAFIYLYFFYRTVIEDLKLMQKLRQRKNGLSSEELALGKQINPLFASRKVDVCINISSRISNFHFRFAIAK
jgi:hypothetical protein